jgi:hypothetical protein
LLVAVNGTMRPGSPKTNADGTPTWSERHAARLMRKFGVRFSVHHPRAEAVKLKMIAVKDMNDWRRVLDEDYVH